MARCCKCVLTHLQDYKSRIRTYNENNHRDADVWEQFQCVMEKLGPQGMSGDETDPQSNNRSTKNLIKLSLSWLHPDISQLMAAADTYRGAVHDECMVITKRGNPGLPRSSQASRNPSTTAAIKKLPRNWYDDTWYRRLTRAEKARLNAQADYPIPVLVLFQSLM